MTMLIDMLSTCRQQLYLFHLEFRLIFILSGPTL